MSHKDNTIGYVCVALCQYLNKYDASVEVLANHCGCSVPTIRRALRTLKKAGVPVKHIRHTPRGSKTAEHYWRLERVIKPGEAGAHLAHLYFPEHEADALLTLFQEH